MVVTAEIPKGYNKTEVGAIPDDWEVKRIRDICDYQNGTSLEKYFNNDDGLVVISIGNYSPDGRFVVTDTYIDRRFENTVRKFILSKDDLTMILNDKTSVGTIIGRVLLIEDDDKYVFNQRTMRLRPRANIYPWFLFHKINCDETHNRIVSAAKPGTQIYINTDDVIDFKIAIPKTVTEQTAIATALSDTDRLIDVTEKLIAKKRNIKQGAMQELLTGKRRLPGFSGKWETKKLYDVFSISAGGDLIEEDFSQIQDEKYQYPIYSNSLENYGLYGFSKTYRHDENCITVTARGTIGVANARDHKFDAIGRVLILRPTCKLNCFFISEYLNNRVKFSIESTGVPQLTAPQIAKYEIGFPDSEEQAAIAQVLSDMDAEIKQLEQKLAKYRMVKQGMMQELLIGRIRLV